MTIIKTATGIDVQTEYEERRIPKSCGCRWNPEKRVWQADDPVVIEAVTRAAATQADADAEYRRALAVGRTLSYRAEWLPPTWTLSPSGGITMPKMRTTSVVRDRSHIRRRVGELWIACESTYHARGNNAGTVTHQLLGPGVYSAANVWNGDQSAYGYNKYGGDAYRITVDETGLVKVEKV